MDEDQIVRRIRRRYGIRTDELIQGIGDDAAVISHKGSREHWVVTTDMLLEEVDFRRNWITPAQLGHKSLAANLSDLAAMGARPRFFTVALALTPDVGDSWLDAFYRGLSTLARKHKAILIGGDLSRSPSGIQITITAIGETFGKRAVSRSGGRPGDYLYVTGVLGKSAAGFALLQQGCMRGGNAAERGALRAHRTPEPRCDVGIWLGRSRFASCMMDLSDGLSMDLPRMCAASRVGGEILVSLLPVFRESHRWCCDPLHLALHGGEDFELLFAVPASLAGKFERAYPPDFPPVTRIGQLRRGRGAFLAADPASRSRPLLPAGFDHFRRVSPQRSQLPNSVASHCRLP